MNAFPVKYNKEHYVVMSNDIIRGKQELSLQEARLLRLVITQVVKEDKDLKTYKIKLREYAEYFDITHQSIFRDIKDICHSLMSRVITIEKKAANGKKTWEMLHWVQYAKYDDNGCVTIMLSEQLKPFVLELEKWFTQYKFQEILSMRSYYAIRMYELLRCQDGISKYSSNYHEISMADLRFYFACDDKFKKVSQFKAKVIDTAIGEINEKSDIFVTADYIKTGRTITAVRFNIRTNYTNIKERQNERAADR